MSPLIRKSVLLVTLIGLSMQLTGCVEYILLSGCPACGNGSGNRSKNFNAIKDAESSTKVKRKTSANCDCPIQTVELDVQLNQVKTIVHEPVPAEDNHLRLKAGDFINARLASGEAHIYLGKLNWLRNDVRYQYDVWLEDFYKKRRDPFYQLLKVDDHMVAIVTPYDRGTGSSDVSYLMPIYLDRNTSQILTFRYPLLTLKGDKYPLIESVKKTAAGYELTIIDTDSSYYPHRKILQRFTLELLSDSY